MVSSPPKVFSILEGLYPITQHRGTFTDRGSVPASSWGWILFTPGVVHFEFFVGSREYIFIVTFFFPRCRGF